MTRTDTRKANLRRLVAEYKTIAAVAEAAGASEKYLSQILNDTTLPSGRPREIGNDLARRLESGTFRPDGWLDINHDAPDTTQPALALTHLEAELLWRFRRGDEKHRHAIMTVARLVAGPASRGATRPSAGK